MLDIKFIRENIELIKETCKNKNISLDIDRLLVIDEEKRKLQTEIDHIRAKRNDLNENMKKSRTEEMISETKELKEKLVKIEEEYENICKEYEKLMYMVPNIVSEQTPVGKSEEDNVIIKT
jgi:seryl-tRNA synthetase